MQQADMLFGGYIGGRGKLGFFGFAFQALAFRRALQLAHLQPSLRVFYGQHDAVLHLLSAVDPGVLFLVQAVDPARKVALVAHARYPRRCVEHAFPQPVPERLHPDVVLG
ncbi:MAG: hypothetical protein ACI4XO_02070 [Akkermansia sp.]